MRDTHHGRVDQVTGPELAPLAPFIGTGRGTGAA
jgi:hypothetical protein